MADVSHEPSMEEILSSIKKIISEDSEKSLSVPRVRRQMPRADDVERVPEAATPQANDDVLELTAQQVEEDPVIAVAAPEMSIAPHAMPDQVAELVSPATAAASRNALESLATISAKPVSPSVGLTIDDLARELLRPMLKEWLDENLPGIVSSLVEREIARITRN